MFNKQIVPTHGPVLLASNHSGSFFDALVVGAIVSQPIHTFTRGDVFRNPKVAFWLRQINLIPVFRGSEGRHNLKKIDDTILRSLRVLRQEEIVLVFSEGVCVNEWRLRPLGKGTARMAHQAWFGEEGLAELAVIPTGLTYEHYRGTGKRVVVKFGEPIRAADIATAPADYEKWLREFNELLTARMRATILEVPAQATPGEQQQHLQQYLQVCPVPPTPALARPLGTLGRALHRPLYRALSQWVARRTAGTVFYDSVLFGLLVYLYPLLVVLLSLLVGTLAGWPWGTLVFVGVPLLAYLGNRFR